MSFKGKFELTTSTRVSGVRIYSFVLKCTNLFQSEKVDCLIGYEGCPQPFIFRDQTFKAGRSYRFDFDTVDWQWYQHDYFAILGKNDKIVEKWQLNLKEYKPGECPECHEDDREKEQEKGEDAPAHVAAQVHVIVVTFPRGQDDLGGHLQVSVMGLNKGGLWH